MLLSAALFILTSIAYVVWLAHALSIWLMFAFFVGSLVMFAFIYDILIVEFKWSVARVLLLAFGVMAISAIVTQSVWTIVTPSWLFTVTTDKSTYRLGENVTITASLKNAGFVTHSFQSLANNPVLVAITLHRNPYDVFGESVWWNYPWKENITEFSIPAGQSLERYFTWNQTNIYSQIEPKNNSWNQTYMPGTYTIEAFIPDPKSETLSPYWGEDPFIAEISINVTSS